MSTIQGIQRWASRSRRVVGAALATLGVLVALGVGALMITSVRANRTLRPSRYGTPCLEACPGLGYRPRRRPSHTLPHGHIRVER
jgi:hypothetical protein